jgi:predicted negative regulator of RcsB-dependent stress response
MDFKNWLKKNKRKIITIIFVLLAVFLILNISEYIKKRKNIKQIYQTAYETLKPKDVFIPKTEQQASEQAYETLKPKDVFIPKTEQQASEQAYETLKPKQD